MKRSEALHRLVQYLKNSTTVASNELDNQSKSLLKMIEQELKMVPPLIEAESFQTNDSGEMTYAVHKWEPES